MQPNVHSCKYHTHVKHQTAMFWRMVAVLLMPQVSRSTPVVMSSVQGMESWTRPAAFSVVARYLSLKV